MVGIGKFWRREHFREVQKELDELSTTYYADLQGIHSDIENTDDTISSLQNSLVEVNNTITPIITISGC